jgi:hypothetical protein
MVTTPSEFQVLVTEEVTENQSHEIWRAVVLQMPHLVAAAESREEVLSAIKKILSQSVRHAEVVTVSLTGQGETEDLLAAGGYHHYGVFETDPEALKLFDEIEAERNNRLIEPSQP